MNKIRILHTADMHLGANVSMFDSEKNILRKRESEQTARDVFDVCKNVDVVLLSGDIFDSGDVPFRLADFVASCIAECKHTQFFYSCGNHDPKDSKVMEYLSDISPSNLHIFSNTFEFVTLENLGVRVYGASFSSQYCEKSLLPDDLCCSGEYINLLCMHGELTESANSIYNPLSLSVMENAGIDYAALGHVHSFSGIRKCGAVFYAYPGVHEPNGFDECGKKGFICGAFSRGVSELDFVSCAAREYIDECVDISSAENFPELLNLIRDRQVSKDNICRFTLVGKNHMNVSVNREILSSYLGGFYLDISDSTSPDTDFSSVADDISLKGLCAGEIISRMKNASSEDKDKIQRAGILLLELLEGRGEGIDY